MRKHSRRTRDGKRALLSVPDVTQSSRQGWHRVSCYCLIDAQLSSIDDRGVTALGQNLRHTLLLPGYLHRQLTMMISGSRFHMHARKTGERRQG